MKSRMDKGKTQIGPDGERFEAEELFEQIRQGLNSVDRAYGQIYKTPDISELQHMVAQHRAASRRKLRQELLMFWGIAILILASCFLLANSSLQIYGIAQIVITVTVIGVLLGKQLRLGKQRRERRAPHDHS